MVNIIQRSSVSLRDQKGHVGKVSFFQEWDQAVAGADHDARNQAGNVIAALTAMSNAAWVGATGIYSPLQEPNLYGTSAVYSSAEDKARLVYLAVDDDIAPVEIAFMTYEIPAPKAAIFYADGETVNGAQALVAAFTAAIQTAGVGGNIVVTRTGLLPGAFVGGYRVRRKAQRKITVWVKSPNLDEPEE